MSRITEMPFYERYMLTVEEASAYFHIGPKKMREIVREYEGANWILYSGNRIMIKKALFSTWIDGQSAI